MDKPPKPKLADVEAMGSIMSPEEAAQMRQDFQNIAKKLQTLTPLKEKVDKVLSTQTPQDEADEAFRTASFGAPEEIPPAPIPVAAKVETPHVVYDEETDAMLRAGMTGTPETTTPATAPVVATGPTATTAGPTTPAYVPANTENPGGNYVTLATPPSTGRNILLDKRELPQQSATPLVPVARPKAPTLVRPMSVDGMVVPKPVANTKIETNPVVPISPAKTPDAVDPAAIALAQKIRSGAELTQEELAERSDPAKWKVIEKELTKLAKPEAIKEENLIEQGKPTLGRLRSDFAAAIFKNRKALYENKSWLKSKLGIGTETLTPWDQEHLKSLQTQYDAAVNEGFEKIQPKGERMQDKIDCTKARLDFLKNERNAFNKELFQYENEETKKRINKAIDKAISSLRAVKDGIGKQFDAVAAKLTGNKDQKYSGLGFLTKLALLPAAPAIIGAYAGNAAYEKVKEGANASFEALKKRFGGTNTEKKKSAQEAAPAANMAEAAKSLSTPKVAEDQENKTELPVAVEQQKVAFIENAMGERLDGNTRNIWNGFKKMPASLLVYPDASDADWGTTETGIKITHKLEDFPAWAQTVSKTLKPYVEQENIPAEDLKAMSTDELISRAVKAGFIK